MLKRLANEILKQIIKHYGKSKFYNNYPTISFDSEDSLLSGEWRPDWCEIVLYNEHLNRIHPRDVAVEIATILLHEYTHYLQSPTWMTRYNKMYDYYNHPYEIEAYKNELQWRKILPIQNLIAEYDKELDTMLFKKCDNLAS